MSLVVLVFLSTTSLFNTEAVKAGMGLGYLNNNTVQITSLDIPESPKVGQDVTLTCSFKLGGSNHRLYTVNWWRERDQFYTYKANTIKSKLAYTFDGIRVKKEESTAEKVVLENVSEATSGVFKCEVMGEAPSFRTATKTKYMGVVVPPRLVEINDGIGAGIHRGRFRSGDRVMLNCTAKGSKPKATIMWHLNGIPVRANNMFAYDDYVDKSGHVTSTSGIRWIAPDHFRAGVAKVTCVASVASFTINATKILYLDYSSSAPYIHRYYSAGKGTIFCNQCHVTGILLHLLTLLLATSLYYINNHITTISNSII